MTRATVGCTLAAVAACGVAGAQEKPTAAAELMRTAPVKAALDAARMSEPQTIEDGIRFCEVPAPSFK